MVKQIYKYMAVLLLAGMVIGCSPEALDNVPLTESDVPIQLSGAVTRALGESDDPGDGQLITTGNPLEDYSGINFRLTARTVDAPVSTYFINRPIGIGDASDDGGRNKITGNVYYPLGQKEINLYAYTRSEIAANGDLTLLAGTQHDNDYLLGTGTEANGTTPKSGKSDNPIEHITFKHLMTRVDVKIEVDGDVQTTIPTTMTMRFVQGGPIVNRGTYNIFTGGNVDGNATNNANAEYSFSNIGTSTTTHYLVPNGSNLTTTTDQIASYLKIDDYVAKTEDLKALQFSQADKGGTKTDFVLAPGLAYDLTFVINRLKIVDIRLTLKDWDPKSGSTEWDYEPKTITLQNGTNSDYIFDEANQITQMVLKYKDTDDKVYQYIGAGSWESGANRIDFVTLPADLTAGELTADLYTTAGLLVDGVSIEPSGTLLEVLDLGRYGMKKKGAVLEISTPLQFALMLNSAYALLNQEYLITKTLDMGGVSIELKPTVFPTTSVLDGGGNEILNLEINGNGMFTQNQGTVKNFRIVSGVIKGTSGDNIGSVCAQNFGTIEGVVNQADIRPAPGQIYAGGITGWNENAGVIAASVNSGNILGGSTVGGIAGGNGNTAEGAITACLNVGMLHKDATDIGGILGISGSASNEIVKSSFWLTGTARKNQGISNELAIGSDPGGEGVDGISADLAESTIRNEALDLLNSALSAASKPWKFVMIPSESSWPIPVPNP